MPRQELDSLVELVADDWQWLADRDLTRRTGHPRQRPSAHGIGQLEHHIRVLAAVLRARRVATTVPITEILGCHRTYLNRCADGAAELLARHTSTLPRPKAPRHAPARSCRPPSTRPGNIKTDSSCRTGSGQPGTRPSGTSRLNWPFTREICTAACPIRREQRPSPDARPGHPPAHIRHTHGDWLCWSRCSAACRLNPGMTTAAPRSAIRCRCGACLARFDSRPGCRLPTTHLSALNPEGWPLKAAPALLLHTHGRTQSLIDHQLTPSLPKKAQLRGYTPRHHYRSCTLDLRIAMHRIHVSD